jgi:methyltransferase family protein
MGKLRNLLSRAFLKAAFTVDPPKPQTETGDDYIMWLCFANAGMLDKGNLFLIDHAIKHLPSDAPLLEIGSFCGLSTNLLTHYKRKYARKNPLITCDKWAFENTSKDNPHLGASPVLFSDYKSFVRDSYLRNVRLFSPDDLPFTVEATSEEFFAAWKQKMEARDVLGKPITLGGPLSLCYIDGDHTYEGVKKDFLNCDAFLEPGGFLLFDDSAVAAFGVRNLMPEVEATGRYKLVATNPNHLFQKLQA